MMEYVIERVSGELKHHGVKGQKHGERRYQNPDGSLTPEGREHYGVGGGRIHQYRMKSIDRSIQRGRDLDQRGKASHFKNVAMGFVRQVGIELAGKAASNLGVDNSAVNKGIIALSALNLGLTVSRGRDIYNYRHSNNSSKFKEENKK